jgi:sortase A
VHRPARILSTALITAGVVVLADAATTLLWQEPVSAAYSSLQQGRASGDLDDLEAEFATGDLGGLSLAADAAQAKVLAERFARQIDQGDPIGRIKIDDIGADFVFFEGTDTATLQHGPGHYEVTPLPGERGTVAIAGHRTTYLAPFRKINEIEDGDEIRLEMPYGAFNYVVEKHEIVEPKDTHIINPVGYDRLVLTACHPLYSAAQRWAIFAKLDRIDTFAISGEGRWPTL